MEKKRKGGKTLPPKWMYGTLQLRHVHFRQRREREREKRKKKTATSALEDEAIQGAKRSGVGYGGDTNSGDGVRWGYTVVVMQCGFGMQQQQQRSTIEKKKVRAIQIILKITQ